MLVLVISMVTTFLMGMLLTETLWGQGLDYFGSLKKQTKLSGAYAASAADPYLYDRTKSYYLVSIKGTVNSLGQGVFLFDESVRIGTPLVGEYIFAIPQNDALPDDPQSGLYVLRAPYKVTVGNYTFNSAGDYTIGIYDMDGSQGTDVYSTFVDEVTVQHADPHKITPVSSMTMQLGFPGTYFTSDALPNELMVDPTYVNTMQVYPAVGAQFSALVDSVRVTRVR
jgi:hypothetical protein